MGDAAGPVRTCAGCRVRDVASALLRVVVDDGSALRVVTDSQRGRFPGRGASLHPVIECLELAERRRAFARSFRRSGPFDTTDVRSWIERCSPPEQAGNG